MKVVHTPVRASDVTDSALGAELDVGTAVPRLSARGMTPLQFHQRFVSRNKPLVLTDAIADWPALQCWSFCNHYVASVQGRPSRAAVQVTVAATPDGRADAVTTAQGRQVFALPHEQRMSVG